MLDLGTRGVQSWGETQQPIWRTAGDNGDQDFILLATACPYGYVKMDGDDIIEPETVEV